MPRRPQKTIVDYLAILISPALIMLLVGSIVYFILEVGYEGKWTTRLKWVMFWFVIASVLIGRVAIERGSALAGFYALGLATAIGLWTNKFMGTVPLVWCLLGFVWWFTHMMTKDCTLIDDSEDSSGEGLLQASGIEKKKEEAAPELSPGKDGLPSRPPKEPPAWARLLPNFGKRKGKPHAPGKWLVWFSIFALPAFGVGHALLDDGREAAKNYGFQLLCVYVVAALCLLMTTSFLGLRRYLRQRFLRMPMTVTGLWMIMGGIIAVFILGIALLLPRPNATYDMTAMIDQVADQVQKASDKAFTEDGIDDDTKKNFKETKENVESDRGEKEKSTGGKKQGESGSFEQGAKPGEKKDGQGNENSAGDSKDKKADVKGKDSFEKKQSEKQDKSGRGGDDFNASERKGQEKSEKKADPKLAEEGKLEQPDPKPSMESPQWVGPAVKAAFYIIIGGVALFFLIKHHKAILAGLKKFWEDLLAMFGKRKRDPKAKAVAPTPDEPIKPEKPFRKYQNPFVTGMVNREPIEAIVNYSYRAMEAWAYEQDLPRQANETPNEYGEWLSENAIQISEFAPQMAQIYSAVAYTHEDAPDDSLEVIKGLWNRMT